MVITTLTVYDRPPRGRRRAVCHVEQLKDGIRIALIVCF